MLLLDSLPIDDTVPSVPHSATLWTFDKIIRAIGLQATGGSQRYEAVGWDGDGLIVFRSKSEMDLEDITISQPVQRMASSRQGWILDLNPCAVRSTGCRTFRRLPVRSKDSQED